MLGRLPVEIPGHKMEYKESKPSNYKRPAIYKQHIYELGREFK